MVVQLHNHSHYSILDGRSRISEMVSRAKELGQGAMAITDHGVMHGCIEFYREATKAGVKPIIGMEAYMSPASMLRRDPRLDGRGTSFHLTLLAMNEAGYKNLLKLTSKGHVEGYYYNPRIDFECLAEHSNGIFVLSGCMGGQISSAILQDDRTEAERIARSYREVFGDRYAIEVMWHDHEKQPALNRGLLEVADALGIPAVATCDSHYARPEDAESHDAMLAIQTGAMLDDPSRFRVNPYGAYYIQSEQDMRRGFSQRPDVLINSDKIAERCNLTIDFSRVMLPEFPVPNGHTPSSYLKQQVYDGLKWRYGSIGDEYKRRADYELQIIDATGYSLYFLIVQDYVQYARRQGVMAVPRGSVAGSLCVYALGICDIDPIKYDIMFERFLHAERKGMPDIDMDFADDRRDDVIQYVTNRYGKDRVAHVGTFQTLGARAAIKDVARIMGLPFSVMNGLTAQFPDGPSVTIDEALQDSRVRAYLEKQPALEGIVALARGIEGLTRGFGTHAAGMLIAATPLDDVVPVQPPPGASRNKADATLVTQYDNNNETSVIESLGLFKFDFLGLVNLSVIRDACALINKRHGIDLYGESGEKLYSDLPLEYGHPMARKAYDLLSSGNTEAIFQVESAGMRRVLRLVKPSRISDLPAIVALYRPGPMDYIPEYADAKHGRKAIYYLHDDLKPLLEETYGVVTYQDQVLLIAREIAGFTWGEVDVLRKGMGKKQHDVIDALRIKFVDQSVARGYERSIVEDIWNQIAPFAGYGFNRAHAYCYGYISFITAYLKANFPIEYMVTVLTHESGNKDKISQSVLECRRIGIDVIPPSVNVSSTNFSIATLNGREVIAFGLSAIGGMGMSASESIIKERSQRRFSSFSDFINRADFRVINRRTLSGMIHGGAFDEFGHRAQLDEYVSVTMKDARESFQSRQGGQLSLLGAEAMAAYETPLPDVPAWPRIEALRREFEALGVYVSDHPLDDVRDHLRFYCTITSESMENLSEGPVVLGGLISRVKQHTQKKDGKQMAFVTVEDMSGKMDVVFFARTYAPNQSLIQEGNRVLIRADARSREGEMSIVGNEIILMKEGVSSPLEVMEPADIDWSLSAFRISSRITTCWKLYSTELSVQSSDTCRLRIVSDKGDIDIVCALPKDSVASLISA